MTALSLHSMATLQLPPSRRVCPCHYLLLLHLVIESGLKEREFETDSYSVLKKNKNTDKL